MTTRTLFTVKLIKQDKETTRAAGALSLWLTEDGRFELRGDDLLDMTAGERGGMEWGVWDRQAGREGDWADGGRGNGVDSMNEGAKLIRDVLAAEAAKAPMSVDDINRMFGLPQADPDVVERLRAKMFGWE